MGAGGLDASALQTALGMSSIGTRPDPAAAVTRDQLGVFLSVTFALSPYGV